jgi:single-stranded DNA-binding protein
VSGNVGVVDFGRTSNEEDVCSFLLAIEKKKKNLTWVRVNVFGDGLVKACKQRLARGGYVLVNGELMERVNSSGSNTVVEIRCLDIKFIDLIKGGNDDDDGVARDDSTGPGNDRGVSVSGVERIRGYSRSGRRW